MFDSLKKKVQKTLDSVVDPAEARVEGVSVKQGIVTFALAVDPARGGEMEPLRAKAESAVAALPGVEKVTAVLTAETVGEETGGSPLVHRAPKAVVAVASGKGGVGKSTVAANMAVALAQAGQAVGLMDADVFGPSVPRLMGVEGARPGVAEDNRMIPPEAHGVKLMSMGFLVPPGKAVVWRGAMVHKGILQMFSNTVWGDLDVLLIDMPPGTGDAQLTVAQNIPLSGAVVVSTPQDLALLDARKAIEMFARVDVSVLGIVENMSFHICTACGHEDHIFSHGGAAEEAKKQNVSFLGEIPLRKDIRESADSGTPLAAADQEGDQAKRYALIADRLMAALRSDAAGKSCRAETCGCH